MLRIVENVIEVKTNGHSWSLIDDDTGKWLGEVDPNSMEVILQEDGDGNNGFDGYGNQSEKNNKEKGNGTVEKSMEEENTRIPLTEKRLLDIEDFQAYTSLGKNRATDLAKMSGAIYRVGRRKLIDRVKFDAWCDAQ